MSKRRRESERYAASADEWPVPVPRVRGFAELASSRARHVAAIAEAEREIARLQAEQLKHASAFVRDQVEEDTRRGIPQGEPQHRAMVAEMALARGTSTVTASSWLADAWMLDEDAPATLGSLERGEISLWSARSIAREIGFLDDIGLRRLADEVIAEEAPGLLPGKVAAMARTRVIGIDPAAADARAEAARRDKHVSHRTSDEPGVGVLEATLPIEQSTACYQALREHARKLFAAGDPAGRTLSELICDTLVERVTGRSAATPAKVHLNLVMSDTTLLGLEDRPAQLLGAGPLPPGLARRILAAGGRSVTRLFTDPVDGTVVMTDSRRRRFSGRLRRLLLTRDSECRGPNCPTAPIDLDHLEPYAAGGRTRLDNGQGLSKGCHTMRDHPGVGVRSVPGTHLITWTLPSGQTASNLPPPALGHGTSDRTELYTRRLLTDGPLSATDAHIAHRLKNSRAIART